MDTSKILNRVTNSHQRSSVWSSGTPSNQRLSRIIQRGIDEEVKILKMKRG